jgi:DNA-binding transcriptional ArsR family regulator
MQVAPPDFDRVFAALADRTRRDIVRRAIDGEEGIVELAGHFRMSFAAVQKHVAVLERAGLITKERVGRRKVVRTNLEALRVARRLLDQYEALWRARIDRMHGLIAETAAAEIAATAAAVDTVDSVDTADSKENHR